jgi:hypothetical protein
MIRQRVASKLALSSRPSAVQQQGLLAVTRRAYGNSEDKDSEITHDLLKSEIMAGES